MIRAQISMNDVKVFESYKVKKKSEMEELLDYWRGEYITLVFQRTNKSLINEWRSHNLLYNLHLFRSHTTDVDLNYPEKWYMKIIYGIISFIYIWD